MKQIVLCLFVLSYRATRTLTYRVPIGNIDTTLCAGACKILVRDSSINSTKPTLLLTFDHSIGLVILAQKQLAESIEQNIIQECTTLM